MEELKIVKMQEKQENSRHNKVHKINLGIIIIM